MTKGALNTNGCQDPSGIKDTGNTDDGIQLEQRNCDRWIIQIERAALEWLEDITRQGIHIHLQSRCEGSCWADAGTNSAQSGALDSLVQFECIAPKRLVAEGVKPKDLPSGSD